MSKRTRSRPTVEISWCGGSETRQGTSAGASTRSVTASGTPRRLAAAALPSESTRSLRSARSRENRRQRAESNLCAMLNGAWLHSPTLSLARSLAHCSSCSPDRVPNVGVRGMAASIRLRRHARDDAAFRCSPFLRHSNRESSSTTTRADLGRLGDWKPLRLAADQKLCWGSPSQIARASSQCERRFESSSGVRIALARSLLQGSMRSLLGDRELQTENTHWQASVPNTHQRNEGTALLLQAIGSGTTPSWPQACSQRPWRASREPRPPTRATRGRTHERPKCPAPSALRPRCCRGPCCGS